jgi:O-methyltransferase
MEPRLSVNPQITVNSLLDSGRLEFLRDRAIEVRPLEGDLCEVGVYKGGSALLLCEHNSPNSHMFLIDTFCGLPQECTYDNYHKQGDFGDTSVEHVMSILSGQSNFTLLKQVFSEDVHLLVDRQFKLVHLDVDLYSSYISCLEFFHSRMVRGGYIVLDDYGASSCLGAKKATDEFVGKHGLAVHQGSTCQFYLKY